MNTFDYIVNKYKIDVNSKLNSPIVVSSAREELAKLFNELGFKVGVEVGVDRGRYSELLCQINHNLKLYSIDPWKVLKEYRDIQNQDDFDKRYKNAVNRLKPYNCTIIKKTSMEAIKDFKPESIDFVYIDGNHDFKYVLEDMDEWAKIVKPGGIVSGDDYIWWEHKKINYDVQNALKVHHQPFFLFNNERCFNWFYIKE